MTLRWAILIAVAVLCPAAVQSAYASPSAAAPPSHIVALLESERGVQGARCAVVPPRGGRPTYLCTVRVTGGCVAAVFQLRHGVLGWYGASAHPVKCWKSLGGPTD